MNGGNPAAGVLVLLVVLYLLLAFVNGKLDFVFEGAGFTGGGFSGGSSRGGSGAGGGWGTPAPGAGGSGGGFGGGSSQGGSGSGTSSPRPSSSGYPMA